MTDEPTERGRPFMEQPPSMKLKDWAQRRQRALEAYELGKQLRKQRKPRKGWAARRPFRPMGSP